MISTRYAFQRLKVKGQGSDFSTTPALYKGEQNRARSQFSLESVQSGASAVCSLEGSEKRTELEAVRRGKVRTELGSELRGEKSESW